MKPIEYLQSVKAELGKVVWPKKDEVKGMTAVVLILTAFMSIYFFLLDTALSRAVQALLG